MDQMKIDSPWKLTTVQGSGPFPQQEIDVSGIKRKWLDVAYADESPAQKLDIFLPDGGKAYGIKMILMPPKAPTAVTDSPTQRSSPASAASMC